MGRERVLPARRHLVVLNRESVCSLAPLALPSGKRFAAAEEHADRYGLRIPRGDSIRDDDLERGHHKKLVRLSAIMMTKG